MELKNLDSNVLCRELSVEEMQSVNGGFPWIPIAIAVALSFLCPSKAY